MLNTSIKPIVQFAGLVAVAFLLGGCAESNWIIPGSASDAPSKMWSQDPRTRGWDRVIAEYALMGDGSVHAYVHSADRPHQFWASGVSWYENERGDRFDSYETRPPFWVVRFGDQEERYRPGDYSTGRGRALLLAERPTATVLPLRPNRFEGQNTVLWTGEPWPCEIFWGDTSDRAAVAVYVFGFGPGGAEGKGVMPWLIAAVWSDGRVVASADQVEGGRPYLRGRIDAESAGDLIRRLSAIAAESGEPSTIKPHPPDYAETLVQFRTNDGHVYELGSCHELLGDSERNHELVKEVEANFRRTWANIRRAITNAIPKKMEPTVEGAMRFELVKRER